MEILIGCVLVVTCLAIYSPIVYIRKADKLQKTLEQIEVNTRKN
jgi:hypothetical protein